MERFLVYFWETECGQYVKIGHCKGNLHNRKRWIQTGCPMLICEAPSGVILCRDKQEMLKTERATQKQFKACKTSGEWFRLTSEISAYIQEFTEGGLDILEADREAQRKRNRERCRERYQNDPEAREAQRKRNRERYQNDPEAREAQRKYHREYRKNPEAREAHRKRQREWRKNPEAREYQRKYQRERYQNDPEVREYQRKYQQEYRARKKQERQPISGQQLELAFEVSTAEVQHV